MPNWSVPRKIRAQFFPILISLLFFAAALFALHRALGEFHYHQVLHHLQTVSGRRVMLALLLTCFGYLVLTAYDHLAVAYVGRCLPRVRITLASFVSYAFSNTIGFSLLTGGSLRYRFYSSWGLSPEEIVRIVAFTICTFLLGIFTLGGALFLAAPPHPASLSFLPSASVRSIGAVLLLVVLLYLYASVRQRRPFQVKAWEFSFPNWRLAALQLLVGTLDWALAGSVLFILLPDAAGISLAEFLGIYLLAQTVALISHVPGGLGVFETLIVSLLPEIPAHQLLATLLIFRGTYYLLPLGVATLLLAGVEVSERRTVLRRLGTLAGRWASVLAPPIFASATLVAGTVLLLSGATPAVPERLRWLRELVPLPLLEVSHLLGSLTGAALLVLARGLQRRLDGAFHLTVGLLVAGIVFSLLKGADYEEAAVLGLVLLSLLPCRSQFYRKATLREESFSLGWLAAILAILVSSVWLGVFSFKHVEFTGELWWTFTLHGNASRFLRAEVGAVALLLLFGIARLLRPARSEPVPPGPDELELANRIVQRSPRTEAHLALLGDKELLFSDSGNAFIMYGIEGRSWVAMGDPVGSPAEGRELVWRFRELSERHCGWAVYYEVAAESLPLYLDLGLTILKIGETARIPLNRFSLEGGEHKGLRQGYHRLERENFQFGIAEAEEVSVLIPELKKISEAWLRQKNTREKGFSLGFFQPQYLQRLPVAWMRQDGRIVAFANLWFGAGQEELSIDLMRFLPEISRGIMDFLLVNLLLWGKNEGYRWFNLGIAPFSGLEDRPHAPFWNRLGALIYRHGEHFYNFQGLREYKDKFNPVWEPRYLALPGGIILPQVLTNIATLVSGGVRGVLGK